MAEILDFEGVKLYLRLDGSDEDELVKSLIEYSKEEIEDSTGADFETYGTTETYKLLQKIIVTDRYENRGSTDAEFKVNNIYSSICTRLKLKVEADADVE